MSSFARDPLENYGFVLRYSLLDGEGDLEHSVEAKENTYSLQTAHSTAKQSSIETMIEATLGSQYEKHIVFKNMRKDLGDRSTSTVSSTRQSDSEEDLHLTGKESILRILASVRVATANLDVAQVLPVKEEDIRTLEDAEKSEGWLAKFVHSVEHFIWL